MPRLRGIMSNLTDRIGDVKPGRFYVYVFCGRDILVCLMSDARRFPPPWTVEELDAITANQPMTAEQAATLKRLAEAAYELEAFQPNLTRAEAALRIAMLTAKLKLLDGPPHTL